MKELGRLLREKRESLKISLEEVSISTKISVKILQALEDGDLSKLPAKPFVRGFVQSYARFLGLDVKEVLEKFSQEVGTTRPQPALNVPEADTMAKSMPTGGRGIITAVAIVVMIIAIIGVQRFLAQREAERTADVQAITGNDSPLQIKPSASPGLSPDASASPDASGVAASASPSGSAAAAVGASASPSAATTASASSTPTATPTPVATATPTPVETSTPTPKPTATPTPTPEATATPEADEGAPQEIIVEALDHVAIKVTVDDESPQEINMNADQILTFKAQHKLKLYTANGGAISVIQNGFDLGVPGNLGQPKSMVFPK